MKKLSFVAFLFFLSTSLLFSQNWQSTDYTKHTWRTFNQLQIIHEKLDPSDIDYSLLHAAVFYVTNEYRVQNQLKPFQYATKMELVAAGHAADMVKYNFYGHQSKIRNKRKLRDRFQIQGLNPVMIGENISSTAALQYEYGRKVERPQSPGVFVYQTSKSEIVPMHSYISYAREIVRLWMESPGHRANILNPSFTYLGTGSAVYGEKSFYNMPYFMNVQCFGSD